MHCLNSKVAWFVKHKRNISKGGPSYGKYTEVKHQGLRMLQTKCWFDCRTPVRNLCPLFLQCVHSRFPTLLAGGLRWWLWLPTHWSSQEWWRLWELVGDRSSVWTPGLAAPYREPQRGSHIIEACSQCRRERGGDEIWTPFNIPPNNRVDKHHELPSAGMSWHLDN